jgi:hypothetical protein
METIVGKGGRYLLRKLIGKWNNYEERNEVFRLENEVVIYEIIFGMVHGWPYKELFEIPHILVSITRHYN